MQAAGRSQLIVAMILAWSVIFFIHLFVFPVYEGPGESGTSSGGSLAALEGALCGRPRLPAAHLVRNGRPRRRPAPPCPPVGIATVWPAGRTGNLISEYAALWAVARRTGLEAYAPPCLLAPLSDIFANLTMASLGRVRHCRARWTSVVDDPRAWNRLSQSLVLPAYTVLPEEIVPLLPALQRELVLTQTLRENAQAVLRALIADRRRLPVFVGVHVRRTDYASYLRQKLNAAPAPLSFYLEAMSRFERRFPDALFVVVSDEPGWCEELLARGRSGRVRVASAAAAAMKVVIGDEGGGGGDGKEDVESERARLDLAVLAACNHTIFDYGTFGLWGALLAGGDTVVYHLSDATAAEHVSGATAAVRVARALPGWSLLPEKPPPPLPPPPPPRPLRRATSSVGLFLKT